MLPILTTTNLQCQKAQRKLAKVGKSRWLKSAAMCTTVARQSIQQYQVYWIAWVQVLVCYLGWSFWLQVFVMQCKMNEETCSNVGIASKGD